MPNGRVRRFSKITTACARLGLGYQEVRRLIETGEPYSKEARKSKYGWRTKGMTLDVGD